MGTGNFVSNLWKGSDDGEHWPELKRICVCGVDMCTNCNANRIAGCGSSLLSRSMFFVGD